VDVQNGDVKGVVALSACKVMDRFETELIRAGLRINSPGIEGAVHLSRGRGTLVTPLAPTKRDLKWPTGSLSY